MYYDYGETTPTVTNLTTTVTLSADSQTLGYWGNVGDDPEFADTGSGGYHLDSLSPSSIYEGGIDGSSLGADWGFETDGIGNSIDKDDLPRSGDALNEYGWSMGAYEYDN